MDTKKREYSNPPAAAKKITICMREANRGMKREVRIPASRLP